MKKHVLRRHAVMGRTTEFFAESRRQLLPLLLRHEGGGGLGRGGRPDASFACFPLSLTLSPFVPHGERELVP